MHEDTIVLLGAVLFLFIAAAAEAQSPADPLLSDDIIIFCERLPLCNITSSHGGNNTPLVPPLVPTSNSGFRLILRDCCIPDALFAYVVDDSTTNASAIFNSSIVLDGVRARMLAGVVRVNKAHTDGLTVHVINCVLANVTDALVATGALAVHTNTSGFNIAVLLRNTTITHYIAAQMSLQRLGLVVSHKIIRGALRNISVSVIDCDLRLQMHLALLPGEASEIAFVAQWFELYTGSDLSIGNEISNVSFLIQRSTLRPTDFQNPIVGVTDTTVVALLEIRHSVTRMMSVDHQLVVQDYSLRIEDSHVHLTAPSTTSVLFFKGINATKMHVWVLNTNISLRSIGNLPIFSASRSSSVIDPAGSGNVVTQSSWVMRNCTFASESAAGLSTEVVDQRDGPRLSYLRSAEVVLFRPVIMSFCVIEVRSVTGTLQVAGGLALPHPDNDTFSTISAKIAIVEASADAVLAETRIDVSNCAFQTFAALVAPSSMAGVFFFSLVSFSIVSVGPGNTAVVVSVSNVVMVRASFPVLPLAVSYASVTWVSTPTSISGVVLGCSITRAAEAFAGTSHLVVELDDVFMLHDDATEPNPAVVVYQHHTCGTFMSTFATAGGTIDQLFLRMRNVSFGLAVRGSSSYVVTDGGGAGRYVRRRVMDMHVCYFSSTPTFRNSTWVIEDCSTARLLSPSSVSLVVPVLTVSGDVNITLLNTESRLQATDWVGMATSTSSLVHNVVLTPPRGSAATVVIEFGPGCALFVVDATPLIRATVVFDTSLLKTQADGGGIVHVGVESCDVYLYRCVTTPATTTTTGDISSDDDGHSAVKVTSSVRIGESSFVFGSSSGASNLLADGTCTCSFACPALGTKTLPMLPPSPSAAQPPQTAKRAGVLEDGTAVLRAVNALASVVSLSWTPTGIFSAQRGWAMRRVAGACNKHGDGSSSNDGDGAPSDDNQLDVLVHPLQFSVGPSSPSGAEYVRGAVLGNTLGVYTCSWAAMVLCSTILVARRQGMRYVVGPQKGIVGLRGLLLRAVAPHHVPGLWLSVVFPLLLGAVVFGATFLLVQGENGGDVVLGVFGLLFVLACIGHASYVLIRWVPRHCTSVVLSPTTPRRHKRGRRSRQKNSCGVSTDVPKHLLHVFFHHRSSAWRSRHPDLEHAPEGAPRGKRWAKHTHELYAPLYDAARPRRQWWLVVELVVASVIGVCSGLAPAAEEEEESGGITCLALPWVLLCVNATMLAAALLLHPYDRPMDQALLVVLLLSATATAVISVTPFGSTDGGEEATLGMDVTSSLLSIAVTICDVIRWRCRWVTPWQTQTEQDNFENNTSLQRRRRLGRGGGGALVRPAASLLLQQEGDASSHHIHQHQPQQQLKQQVALAKMVRWICQLQKKKKRLEERGGVGAREERDGARGDVRRREETRAV